jgi:kinesin family protein 6/9
MAPQYSRPSWSVVTCACSPTCARQVRDLKEELRLLRGEADDRGPLTAGEMQQLQAAAAAYCSSSAADATLDVPGMGMMHVRALFSILRDSARGQPAGLPGPAAAAAAAGGATAAPAAATSGSSSSSSSSSTVGSSEAQEQVKKLRLQVQQRDNEIAILVSMLKRREASGGGPVLEDVPAGQAAGGTGGAAARGGEASSSGQDSMAALLSADLLADRNKAFELFRKSYRQNEVRRPGSSLC